MKHEFFIIVIVGLLVIAYVLDAVVNPLPIALSTPYEYFLTSIATTYIFTTTSIVLKAIAIFVSLILFLSFTGMSKLVKGAIILVFSGLLQLYALQDIVTRAGVVPVEWSLSFTLAGATLLIPAILYILLGFFGKVHSKIIPKEEPYNINDPEYKKFSL